MPFKLLIPIAFPAGAISISFIAALMQGVQFDGTVNVVSAIVFLGGGALLVAQVPELKKAAKENAEAIRQVQESNMKAHNQLANDMTRVAAILDSIEKRVTRNEERFDDHIENRNRGRGAHA